METNKKSSTLAERLCLMCGLVPKEQFYSCRYQTPAHALRAWRDSVIDGTNPEVCEELPSKDAFIACKDGSMAFVSDIHDPLATVTVMI